MKKILLFICLIVAVTSNSYVYANWFQDIINAINKQSGITNNILNSELSMQRDMLSSQHNIEELIRQMNRSMLGNSGWGTYQYHDYQTYGNGAYNWSDVMRMAGSGGGSNALGQTMGNISNQFPIDRAGFNRGITNTNAQQYYALKSQTVLVTRAASELDYNKIQDQLTYQQMLQQQIEKTKDLKAAMDLSNRIQVEGNLIALEILRQEALGNQQQAVSEQASVNGALANARFLTKQ